MRKALLVLKLVITTGVLVAMLWTANFVNEAQSTKHPQLVTRELKEKLEKTSLVNLQPGEKAFTRARDLLSTGNFDEGREKLLYIVNFHPATESGDEARRILGEMNMDRLLSPDEMSNKAIYKVKRGDSFLRIATAEKTTLDAMMFLNNLTQIRQIHPGDEFVVMALDFRLEIEPEKELITLWEGGEFVKEYRIQTTDLDERKRRFKTKISTKAGIADDRRFPPNSSRYRMAPKVLGLAGSPVELRAVEERLEEGGQAIYLTRSDMEELAMLLRVGNEVVIRYATL